MFTKRRRALIGVLIAVVVAFLLADTVKDWVRYVYAENAPRTTVAPSSSAPDQILLTWSADPRTAQTVQWRTAPTVTTGAVQYRPQGDAQASPQEIAAIQSTVNDPLITNDPLNHRFTAVLAGLNPGAAYDYRVGDPAAQSWSDWASFNTAPQGAAPFSFIYMGDPQVGFEAWHEMLLQTQQRTPKPAFYVIAGDLVNRGNDRDDWDGFFAATRGILDRYPLVPAVGNHEYSRQDNPNLYHELLALPENGPKTIPAERAYHFNYGNALFVILDGNLPPQDQHDWLEEQLSTSNATWKFAVYHQPAYSSAPHRDNDEIRDYWCDLFDKYHLDMALQGHDHAYLRTPPMRDGKRVDSPAEGTFYVVSVSGSKMYKQEPHDYAEIQFADTPTYQVLDIDTQGGDKLTYRAYDMSGAVRDEVIIEKSTKNN